MTAGAAPPEKHNSINLPDGRKLAWSEWGPASGRPVLFCTGAAMSGSLGFGTDHLHELNLRLIAIDRPGLGASDPHLDKTFATWTEDMRNLVSANAITSALAVGFSQGAPFALALASAGLVDAVAVVSGQDELSHPDLMLKLQPDVAGLIGGVQQDPNMFEAYFAQMLNEEGLWKMIIGMSAERDKALYLQPEFSAAFRNCLHEGFSQGPQGYARDLVNALRPWPFRVEDIPVPVDLWFGATDTSTVHSPDFGATLARRLPNSTHVLDPDEAGSILWTRSRDILTQLKSH